MFFFVCYIFGILALGHIWGGKYFRYYIILSAIILAGIAYYVNPLSDWDLYRHYDFLDKFRIYGWSLTKSEYYLYATEPLVGAYYYLLSFFKSNGVLPAVTTFIVYYSLFSIIYNKGVKYKKGKKFIIYNMGFILFTLNFLSIISGIRNGLAFSVFTIGLYLEYEKSYNKIIAFTVYFCSCLIHSSLVILVAIRFLSIVLKGKKIIIIAPILLFWMQFHGVINNLVVSFNNEFMVKISEKINIYFYNGYVQFPILLIQMIILGVITATFIYYVWQYQDQISVERQGFISFYSILLLFIWGSITNYHVFVRFVQFATMASILFNLEIYKKRERRVSRRKYTSLNDVVNIRYILFLLQMSASFICFLLLILYQYRSIALSFV